MKFYYALLLIFFLSPENSIANFKTESSGIEDKILIYNVNDSVEIQFTFYSKSRIQSIRKYVRLNDSLILSGYQYDFFESGRVNKIELYRNGSKSSLLIECNSNGEIIGCLGPNGGQNIIIVINNAIKENTWVKGNVTFTARDTLSRNAISYTYNMNTGQINHIFEYDGYSLANLFAPNGIDVSLRKGKITLIKSFIDGINLGENLYFNRRGQLFIFMYKNKDQKGSGIKVGDIYEFLDK